MPEDMIGFDWCCHQLIKSFNEEDKSLRQLPMVAKLLDDNKTEKIICTVLKLHRPYSSSINLSNVQGGKFSGLESERTVSRFRKRRSKFLCCVHLVHKVGS